MSFLCIMCKELRFNFIRNISTIYKSKPPWNVLFFGNDNFSLYSLKILNGYNLKHVINKLEVVSSNKSSKNDPIEKFALENKLRFHKWPPKLLSDSEFDLGIVVSFGKLIPEKIIKKFHLGILNVHGSLLPRWRGAAPIFYTILNGDKVTGVTVMKIKPNRFDVGDIILQKELVIDGKITSVELHDKLGQYGAESLSEVMQNLPEYLQNAKPQNNDNVTYAPKINPSQARINWKIMPAQKIWNLHRAICSMLELNTVWENNVVKLLDINLHSKLPSGKSEPGSFYFDKSIQKLIIKCQDGNCIEVGKIKVAGNKTITAADFNNGYLKDTSKKKKFI